MQNSATTWVKSGKKGSYATKLEYNGRNKKEKRTTRRRGQMHNTAKKLKGMRKRIDCNFKCVNYFIFFFMQRKVFVGKEIIKFNTEMSI